MKLATVILGILISSCALQLRADGAPGYMGKRLVVSANASSMFFPENWEVISDIPMATRFSYKTEVGLSYAVGKKTSLGFSYYFGNQKYFSGNDNTSYNIRVDSYNTYAAILKNDYMYCKLRMYEFNIKFFAKNFIAPVGIYHQFGIAAVKYQGNMPGDSIITESLQSYNPYTQSIKLDANPYSCVKLSYHVGYLRPINDVISLNFGFGVNFFRGGDSPRFQSTITASNFPLAVMNQSLRRHNLFEFKIGLSWIAI
jgi:hypothetical protein